MLSNRQVKLLDFVIQQHVKTGEPVGSELICEKGGFDVSPATIRNEMVALEDMGYLAQPHTSAGRVPTDKAYRQFVNRLMDDHAYQVDTHAKRRIDYVLDQAGNDPSALNHCVANVLAELTDSMVFTAIEDQDDFFKVGLASMFEFPEFRHVQRMTEMATFFDDFDRMFERIERAFFHDMAQPYQVEVRIGHENPMEEIRKQAVLVARYPLPQNLIGAVTIVGPTRMNYERNLGIVDYATEALRKRAKQI